MLLEIQDEFKVEMNLQTGIPLRELQLQYSTIKTSDYGRPKIYSETYLYFISVLFYFALRVNHRTERYIITDKLLNNCG